MSREGHVEAGRWPVLMSLPPDDPEHREALAHAAGCVPCESERRAAAGLLEELARVPTASALASEALEKAALPVRQALAAEGATRRRAKWAEVIAAAGAFALVLALAARTNGEPWGPAFVLLGAAALVPWLTKRLGPWAPLALAGVSMAFAISRGAGNPVADHLGGFGCAGMEALAAVLPLTALILVARLRDVSFGSLAYAGAAASGALAGQAALLLTCPSHDLGHLLLIHSGMVMLAAMVGAGFPRLLAAAGRP